MEHLFTPESLIAFLTLASLEIVLGIDNVIFIAILAGRLPENQRDKARKIGLLLALVSRILLLFCISWVMTLTTPLFSLLGHPVSGRDLILLIGGLFLLAKATTEIHHKLEGQEAASKKANATSFGSVLVQIALLDIVFSLDSVITAVGMVKHISIMIAAVLVSVGVMLAFSGAIVRFIEKHPTFKMLALSFLMMIGVMLVAEGMGKHIEKGYIYFAMGFSLLVEILNTKMRGKGQPIHLKT